MACVTNLQYEEYRILKCDNVYIHRNLPALGGQIYCLHILDRKYL